MTGDAALLRALLDVEAGLARALERAGLAPAGSGAAVTAAAVPERFDAASIGSAAAGGGNPVIPLVPELTAVVPEEFRGAVHLGATSQDVLDSALMLVLARAGSVVARDLDDAARAAARLARTHRDTPQAGRTLLQQALPTTFGLTAAGWLTGLDAARRRVRETVAAAAVQFGGAAGTLASLEEHARSAGAPGAPGEKHARSAGPPGQPGENGRPAASATPGECGPAVVELLAEELGLAAPVLPWHTERHRITEAAGALAVACGAVAKVARDITLLAQTEVGEVSEASPGGSSTLPHKRNPVAAVSALGCARRAPALAATLFASAEHEYQRAAGAWHAEWEPLLDLLRVTGSAAAWIRDALSGLRVHPERMRANLDLTGGLMLAERVTTLLAPSLGRLQAHDLVEKACAAAVDERVPLTDALTEDPARRADLDRAGIGRQEIEAALDPTTYLGSAGPFVDRALTTYESTARERTAHESEG
ncbi:MAG: 3-carboxy-cis,cis-muconate cycloisomerase [Streptosporangiales bacterium]|nr:3-carboxy-cis,cis-muconate cycloisomerase [Streptosporangiales bacterium]